MRLADNFIGKDGSVLLQPLRNSKIVEVVEVSSASEHQKKLEEIKKSIAKQPSASFMIVAFKTA